MLEFATTGYRASGASLWVSQPKTATVIARWWERSRRVEWPGTAAWRCSRASSVPVTSWLAYCGH
jgi:hypothetical protein